MRFVYTFALCVLGIGYAIGSSIAPLQVETITTEVGPGGTRGCATPGAALIIQATNVSGKSIVGYALVLTFRDPATGAVVHSVDNVEGALPGGTALPAGGYWRSLPKHIPLEKGTNPNYSVAIDSVVFADGSTFGPAQSKGSAELRSRVAASR